MSSNTTNNDVTFQVLDWASSHRDSGDNAEKYIIRLFGMTEEKKTICVEVQNFTPYFYVEIPDSWDTTRVTILMRAVKEKIYPKNFQERKVVATLVQRHKFWGFTNDKLFNFVRLVFDDFNTMRQYMYAFERVINIPQLNLRKKFKVYEANIDPLIRFMHTRDLRACGWITIKKGEYQVVDGDDVETSANVNITAKYTALHPCSGRDSEIQPFTIAAIDIECVSEDGSFPQASRDGDKIIMIATTFSRYGEDECFYKHAVVLGSCNPIPGAEVVSCKTESELLVEWSKMIRKRDPDFITGWNIFGFDEKYIRDRCLKLKILPRVSRLSRLSNEPSEFVEKKLQSSALGENLLYYFNMIGRVNFDLMKVVQRDYKLTSFKLDYVASYFFRETVSKFEDINGNTMITTGKTKGVNVGQYTTIVYNDGVTDYEHLCGKKFKILEITPTTVLVEGLIDVTALNMKHKIYWCQVKDDVKPKEICEMFNGTIEDRTKLVKYNFQDCELCNKLVDKLQILVNNIGMANVCHVPLYYLFIRGQGVKIFSLVSKKCRSENYVIPVIKKKKKELTPEEQKQQQRFEKYSNYVDSSKVEVAVNTEEDDDNAGFEGALVIEVKPGVYLSPIIVLDYASLYPSSMIYRNLSHECIVMDKQYLNLPEYEYNTITYNNLDGTPAEPCIFAKRKDKKKGILPAILHELLMARKAVRKIQATEKDAFKYKVLEGLQLAYKITANSLYGQTGAPTSPIYMKEIAACTTATGREMLQFSQNFVENIFDKIVNYAIDNKKKYMKFMETTYSAKQPEKFINAFQCSKNKEEFFEKVYTEIMTFMVGYHINPKIIYGDTDSVFVDPNFKDDETGKILRDRTSLIKALKLGPLASCLICTLLDDPMRQEFEKIMYPVIFLSKKRYVGNLYTDNPDKYFQKCMGIVLKRRDNANIVKIVCGGIVDYIINKHDPAGAITFTKKALSDIMTGKYSLDKFVITKTLKYVVTETQKQDYKNRNSIAHAVLADRMRERDPGNAPNSNDRIPYVYIVPNGPVKLQGDRIEHVEYAVQHNMKIDYLFYVTNQIMKPAIQFLELISENPKRIFNKVIMIEENSRKGLRPVTSYYE
jgi:DNA polymerase elongation subunit (family B)